MKSNTGQIAERHQQQPEAIRSGQDAWLENFLATAAQFATSYCQTFATLLFRPSMAPQLATCPRARPRTFLIAALLLSGLMIQSVMLYHGRILDGDVFEVFSKAVQSWGLRELLALTIPPLLIVWLAASLTAWIARIDSQKRHRIQFFGGLCHAVAVQLLILALAALIFICLKTFQGEAANDHRLTRDYILAPILLAVLLSGSLQVQNMLAVWGEAAWAQRSWLRTPFSAMLSLACICGVLRAGSATFDFRSSRQLGGRLSMEAWSGKARVLADVLDSQILSTGHLSSPEAALHVEQQIALTNVTQLPHIVPFPMYLKVKGLNQDWQHSIECHPGPLDRRTGWVLLPGETEIISWNIKVPQELIAQETIVAGFTCIEIDMKRWHDEIERPLSERGTCYVSINPSDWAIPKANLARGHQSTSATSLR